MTGFFGLFALFNLPPPLRAQQTSSARELQKHHPQNLTQRASPKRSSYFFVENVGQFDKRIKLQAQLGSSILTVRNKSLILSVLEPLPKRQRKPNAAPPTRQGVNLNLKFVGANKKIKIVPFRRIDTRMSFYLGDNPHTWRAKVPVWEGVRLKNIYPKIDTVTPTATLTATSTPTPTATATPNVPLVTLEVTDANGVLLTNLTTNDNGWYERNPVTVQLTITNPGLAQTDISFDVDFGGQYNTSRFYLITRDTNCTHTTERYNDEPYSYVEYHGACNQVFDPSESRSFVWSLWVQPSIAGELSFRVTQDMLGQVEKKVSIPLAQISPVAIVPGFFVFDPLITNAFYAPLRETLMKLGYEQDKTLFSSSQDFLSYHYDMASDLASKLNGWRSLASQIQWIKQPVQFDLIGHSQGAVIVRTYLEIIQQNYVDVNKVVLVGGPNKGIARAYSVREGLYVKPNDDSDLMNILVPRIDLVSRYICNHVTPNDSHPDGYYVSEEDRYETLHDRNCRILSPSEMLPVPDWTANDPAYLVDYINGTAFPYGRLRNPLLESSPQNDFEDPWFDHINTTYYELNSGSKIDVMKNRLGGDFQNLLIIYSNRPNSTEAIYQVTEKDPGSPLWANGKLVPPVLLSNGDNTVTIYSNPAESLLQGANEFHIEQSGQLPVIHTNLAVYPQVQQKIGDYLIGQIPPFVSAFGEWNNRVQCGNPNPCGTQNVQEIKLQLTQTSQLGRLTIIASGVDTYPSSPVDLLLTDDSGRRLGYDPATGQILSEIPGGLYGHAPEFPVELYIYQPTPGVYTLTIIGRSMGEYAILAGLTDDTGYATLFTTKGIIENGQTVDTTLTLPDRVSDVPYPPDINAGGNISAQVGEPITFSGSVKDINPNDTHTIEWNFGDGGTATGTLTPTHTFNSSGIFTVTMTVTDSFGFSVSDTLQVTVVAPTATPTHTPSSTQTYTSTPTPTDTPTNTPTYTPTFTSTPTNAPTPTPTLTPTPAGTGLNGEVDVILKDSSGNLYIGGQFTATSDGAITLNRIAKWNAATQVWSALGTGLNGAVYGLTMDATGNLYAGGAFTNAGGNANADYIAKWDGATWSALGTGTNNTVYALTFNTNGNLYAGGNFTMASTCATGCNKIAKWNGSTWSALGTGVNDTVRALAYDNSGNVYAGGMFLNAGGDANADRIAKWDGSTWSALGTGMNGTVYALLYSGGSLYAGGSFTTAGTCTSNCIRIARWIGTGWQNIRNGFNNTVYTILYHNGNILAGGAFTATSDGDAALNRIARWNNLAWSPYGDGLDNTVYALGLSSTNKPVAGGAFINASGNPNADALAQWDDCAWNLVGSNTATSCQETDGLNNYGYALAKDNNGNLYVGGEFTAAGNCVTDCKRIAKWNGTNWSGLGTGLNAQVWALAKDGSGNIYAGGSFTDADGNPSADRIAKWDDSTQEWIALGSGLNNTVYALTLDTNGNLYAGGTFINAGGDANADYIAKWNPTTQTWSAVGTGVNSWVYAIAFDTNGNLYAGGGFTSAGTCASDCKYIAKWNGSTWSGLSTGMNFAVRSLAFNAGTLYAGGVFTTAGTCSSNCSRIAKWNGTTWSGVGGGVGNQVYALRFDTSGNLYATGWFETAGSCGSNCQHIAKWNGSAWSALGSGLKYDGMSLLLDGNVYVAGGFAATGDGLTTLNYISKWDGATWSPLD